MKDFANLCCTFYHERDTKMSLVHLLTTSMTKETFPLFYTFLANRNWVWTKFRHLSVCSSSRTFHTMTPHLSDFFEEKAESGLYRKRESVWWYSTHRATHLGSLGGSTCGLNAECVCVVWLWAGRWTPLEEISVLAALFQHHLTY